MNTETTTDEVLHVLPQNLYEVWIVATRPVANNGLGLTAQEARREINGIESLFAYLKTGVLNQVRQLSSY